MGSAVAETPRQFNEVEIDEEKFLPLIPALVSTYTDPAIASRS